MTTYTKRRFAIYGIVGIATLFHIPAALAVELTNLRCEYLANPHGIDVAKPRIS